LLPSKFGTLKANWTKMSFLLSATYGIDIASKAEMQAFYNVPAVNAVSFAEASVKKAKDKIILPTF
jgi:hypothetical protein